MQCTHCKYPDSHVVKTKYEDGDKIVRRRECMRCGMRFNTQEQVKPNKIPQKALNR